jgi:hypothetical protein
MVVENVEGGGPDLAHRVAEISRTRSFEAPEVEVGGCKRSSIQ